MRIRYSRWDDSQDPFGPGLRAGDIVLKINGGDVSPANLASLASDLQAGRSLDIAYERNGQINTTRVKRAG